MESILLRTVVCLIIYPMVRKGRFDRIYPMSEEAFDGSPLCLREGGPQAPVGHWLVDHGMDIVQQVAEPNTFLLRSTAASSKLRLALLGLSQRYQSQFYCKAD